MRSPALTGAKGTMRPPPCAAMTSTAVPTVAGIEKAARKQASEPRRMSRASACQLATPVTNRFGDEKIASPCRSRRTSPTERRRSHRSATNATTSTARVTSGATTG